MDPAVDEVLAFWFGDALDDPKAAEAKGRLWWGGGEAIDAEIRERFGSLHARAVAGELDGWSEDARSRLALVIVLDQFSRNLHRGTPDAFANDARAAALCLEGRALGFDRHLHPLQRCFFYMPLSHAEDLAMQELMVQVMEAMAADSQAFPGAEGFAKFARMHRDIVARFQRFPHRNEILERPSTPQEVEFLASGGPRFGQVKR